jgi:carboxyl-terminal processing protease
MSNDDEKAKASEPGAWPAEPWKAHAPNQPLEMSGFGTEAGAPADETPTPPVWAPPQPQSGEWQQPSAWPRPPAPPVWPPQPQGWPPQPQGWQQPAPSWPPQPQPSWPPQPAPSWPPDTSMGSLTPRRSSSWYSQILALVAACLIAFSGGMVFDHLVFPTQSTAGPNTGATGTYSPLQGSSLYDEALQIVRADYVGRANVTDQQLLYGSIKGMVQALGDTGHSVFLTPEEYQAFQTSLSGQVAGIGVFISSTGELKVNRVLPGSPAEAGGIKAGDLITAVDGVSAADWTYTQLASKIRGKAGTSVKVTVVHAGSTTPVDITMIRANVNVPLVSWGMVPGTKIADIALAEFSDGASKELLAAIEAAKAAGATSIIFDLRGNPGGYASEAQQVASEFLKSGNVYLTEDANGRRTEVPVDTSQTRTDLPMVVLVDHDSASSSEIVAGALQDAGRAKVVGVATVGTGTVLQKYVLSDGSALFLGVEYWLTPNGRRSSA